MEKFEQRDESKDKFFLIEGDPSKKSVSYDTVLTKLYRIDQIGIWLHHVYDTSGEYNIIKLIYDAKGGVITTGAIYEFDGHNIESDILKIIGCNNNEILSKDFYDYVINKSVDYSDYCFLSRESDSFIFPIRKDGIIIALLLVINRASVLENQAINTSHYISAVKALEAYL